MDMKVPPLLYVSITGFSSVVLSENSLVLCDIDDTLLYIIEDYSKLPELYMRYGVYERDAIDQAEREFYKRCVFARPTDSVGFAEMLTRIEESNSVLMFLTARAPESREFTQKNLREVGIDPTKYAIHFTGSKMTKGGYINRNIDIAQYNTVIFIDDQIGNLESVRLFVPPTKLEQYLFCFQHNAITNPSDEHS